MGCSQPCDRVLVGDAWLLVLSWLKSGKKRKTNGNTTTIDTVGEVGEPDHLGGRLRDRDGAAAGSRRGSRPIKISPNAKTEGTVRILLPYELSNKREGKEESDHDK